MNSNGSTKKVTAKKAPAIPAMESEVPNELKQIIHRLRAMTHDHILRRSQLKNKCGRALSTSYVDVANGVFPPPFPIGTRAVGFSSNEIDAWIAAHSFASRSKTSVNMKAFVTMLVKSRAEVSQARVVIPPQKERV